MIFTVINIDTGYLNRPNWLLAGYSVYHRVASQASQPGSQPTMCMTGPRSRHQRRCVRDATDFEFLISFYCKTTIWKFLVRYIVTGCIFVRRAVWDRVRFCPPPPSDTPYPVERWVPPPPPPRALRAYLRKSIALTGSARRPFYSNITCASVRIRETEDFPSTGFGRIWLVRTLKLTITPKSVSSTRSANCGTTMSIFKFLFVFVWLYNFSYSVNNLISILFVWCVPFPLCRRAIRAD